MSERYYEDELKAFCFVEVDGGVCVTGYSGVKERVIIPASLDGKPVTALGVSEEGFTDDMLLDVQIPASVRHVDVRAINSPPVYGWFGVEMEYEDGWVAAFSLAPGNEHLAIIDGMLIEDGKTVVYCRDTEAKTITIPEGIEMIGEYAFRDCTALQKVVLPASLRIIEAHAFEKCGLREVTLPDGLEKIGRCAFRDVLLRITPAVNGLEACEGVALRGMAGHPHFCVRGDLLLSADGKTAVWYLGDGGSELAVPEGVEEIAPYAFARSALSGVKKLTLPSTLRRIGAGAFGENRVKTLRFPENLTDVEDTAFRFSGVTSVLVAKNNPGFRTDKTALYRVHADGSLALLFCFRAKIEEYAVLEGTVRILDGAFADCGQLEQLVLPETLKEFSENCLGRGARKIVVPASVEKLVFRQDDSGVDYEIAAGNPVYFWKDHILYESGADGLRAVRFDGAAKDVALAEGTVSVAPRAFRRRLQSVSFPNSLRRVEHHAFCACGLQSVSLNEGLETIGDAAFASNEIAEVSLPASVTDLSRSAFEECPLRFYRVAEGSASYASPDGALYNLEQTILYDVPVKMAVGTFRVPDTVTEIGRAFHGCTDIREIVFPESVRQFWLKSIVGCEQLRDVWFGDDVEYISESCIDYDFPIALHAEPDSPVANMIEQLRGIVKGRMQLRLIAGGEEDVRNLSADFDLEMNDTGLTILKNRCEKAEVVVPAEIGGRAVTQISAYAFSGSDSRNVQLERVELPDSVKEIGEGVFESCRKLRHVRLPKGITKLPKKLFQYCTSLAELEIPEGVASVEESVFFGCEDLQTLVFPESAVSISEWLFSDGEDSMDNERYKDLYLNPKTIYYAPGGSFAEQFLKAYQPNHYSVKKLTVMNGTPADENLTAAERESLECLDVSVSEDGTVSVSIKRDLKDPPPVVTIPSAIGGMPVTCLTGLSSLNSEIERLRIPASVESVEGLNELSFYIGGNRLRGVDVAEGNPHYWSDGQALYTKDRSVLIHMFDYHAQEYTLCVDTKVIDERAFGYFTNLKKAVLPDGLREIRKDAFYSCGNLAEIVGAENVPVIAEDALTATAYYRTCPVIFRGTALLKYNDASARRCEVPDGTTEIAADAFSIRGNDDALEEVVIPDSVTAIGPNAFSGRAKLKAARLPNGLKKLESGTFRGCAALESICIPAGVSEIAADAFPEYEENWGSPDVVPALREILAAEENPFFASGGGVLYSKDGTRLIRVPPIGAEEFTVPETVTAIGDAAFRGSQILKRVQMTDRVAEIGHGAFDRCKKLEAIDLTHVKRIGSDAFQFCGSLRAVMLSAEKIGDDAFLDCGQLSAVELTGTKIVGDSAFRGCEMLREIRLPDGLEKIGAFAFANCGLQAVTIPKSVRETGSQSFLYCPEITVYDTIDPDAEPCERHLDEYRGTPNSKVGVINSAPCEIVVRSAETDEIKYKVWMNAYAKPGKYSCMLQSSWGRNATFHFAALDRAFPEIQGADEKRRVALNRLRWPVDLAESQRDTYVAYLARSAKDLIRDCIDRDDMETLLFCEPFGVIKKTNIGEMLEYASGKSAAAFTAYLMDYQNRNFSGGRKRAPAFSLKVEEPWTVSRSAPGKVGRYKGTDAELEFPTEVKGEKITGVADTTSKVPENYLAIRSVVLPEGYRAIGDYAFCGCENLETVVLPGTLCSIGRDAFRGCRKLREVILPDSVETLEENAFRGCTSLAQVRFSRNLRKIPGYAFAGCSALKEIELPAGVTMMEKGCFEIFGLQKLTVHCAKMWSEGMCFHNAPTVYAYPGAMNGVYGIARRSIHLLKIVDFPAETEIGLRVSFGADGEETFRFRMEASDAALRKIEVEELDRRLSDAETGAAIADAVRFVYGEPLTSGEANAAEWARLNGLARGEAPAEVAVTEEKRNDDGSASTVYAYRASDRKGTMKAKEIVGQAAGGAAAAEYTDASDERAERSGLWEFSDVETLEFEGKIFVLTGFGAQEESDLTKRIEKRGGSVKSSLVVKTDYLIVMEDYDHQTTKYRKAKELQQKGKNVAILSSKQFYDLTAEE